MSHYCSPCPVTFIYLQPKLSLGKDLGLFCPVNCHPPKSATVFHPLLLLWARKGWFKANVCGHKLMGEPKLSKGLLMYPGQWCWERTILCEITHFLFFVTLGCQNWKPSKSWVIVEDGSCYFKYFGEGLKALTAMTIASIFGSSALNKQDYRKAELNQEAWPAFTAICVIHWPM